MYISTVCMTGCVITKSITIDLQRECNREEVEAEGKEEIEEGDVVEAQDK